MGHLYPLGVAQLIQFVLVALFAVGLVTGLTRRVRRPWPYPLTLAVILILFGLVDVWINGGLGDPELRGDEGRDSDYIGVSVHYVVLLIVAAVSLIFVGLAVRKRHRAEMSHAA